MYDVILKKIKNLKNIFLKYVIIKTILTYSNIFI